MSSAWTLYAATGGTISLDRPDHVEHLAGNDGIDGADVDLSLETVAGRSGGWIREVRYGSHDVVLPVVFRGRSEAELDARIAAVRYALSPLFGPMQIGRASAVGERTLRALYTGGIGGAYGADSRGMWWRRFQLRFRAVGEPWWRDLRETTVRFSAGAQTAALPLTLPFTLSPSQIATGLDLTVPSELPVYPRWVLRGPGDSWALVNETTGDTLTIDQALAADEEIVVDTAWEQPTVIGPSGENLMAKTGVSQPWPLQPGRQRIRVDNTAAGTGTFVELRWRNAFIGSA